MTYLELVQQYFPEAEWGNALAVIEGESRGNPLAINNSAYPDKAGYHSPGAYHPEYSMGLFQINTLAWPKQAAAYNLLDPVQNVQVAAIIYKLLGWSPWSAAKAKGITAGRRYSVSDSSIANKVVVPGAAPTTSAPTPGPSDTPGSGSVGEVGGVLGTMQSTADTLQWLGINAGALVMRATLMGVGSAVVLMGLYFLVRSL